jgi:hypothetical protein
MPICDRMPPAIAYKQNLVLPNQMKEKMARSTTGTKGN